MSTTSELAPAIVRMRQNGLMPAEIARLLGVSRGVVSGVVWRAGLTDRTLCWVSEKRA